MENRNGVIGALSPRAPPATPSVERTIAWFNRCRRLSTDRECLNRDALDLLRWASIRLMARRLARLHHDLEPTLGGLTKPSAEPEFKPDYERPRPRRRATDWRFHSALAAGTNQPAQADPSHGMKPNCNPETGAT